MYEIEYKVELTPEERMMLIALFNERGFPSDGIDQQNDFYIEAKDSPLGIGYDLKRYRDEEHAIFYTEKTWELAGNQPARKEIEREVSRDEFEAEVAKYPDAVKIQKQREWFAGKHKDLPVSITIDSVKFDHSPSMRYFIEAETNTTDLEKVKELKQHIVDFLKDILGKEEIIESPGMFTMAFKKK
jgi:adenylate cyclase class IV